MNNLAHTISSRLLPAVRQPAQYIGGEINQVAKDPASVDVSFALAFPDTYAIGMSYTGLSLLYHAVNALPFAAAHRVFCPASDAASAMRRHNIPLFSWETRTPVRDFDFLGITLQHELCYSNILYLLDLAGITFRAADRHDDEPLVIAGGPLADSCEPVADFFDLVLLGEADEALPAVLTAYRDLKPRNLPRRQRILELAIQFPFLYAPQFYHCEYHPDGRLAACQPTEPDLPPVLSRAVVANLDAVDYPTKPIVPFAETVHDRIALEIMRGCPFRCAFCHAAHTRGKVRTRSIDSLCDIALKSYLATGHDTISLLSLSTSDYPDLPTLVQRLYDLFEGKHVSISLPSLRVDRQLRDLPACVTSTRREGLTVAVEAASDTLRRAIGKKVTDTDLLATMTAAFQQGWRTVKTYFIVGFPGETPADIDAIFDLALAISDARKPVAGGRANVNAAISWLVPKPHTPFQFAAMQSADYFHTARRQLLDRRFDAGKPPIRLKFHHLERSLLEGALARGDRRLSHALEHAYQLGARFDAWDESFRPDLYAQAFRETNIDPAFYAHRTRDESETLPWDHLAPQNRPALHRRYQRILTKLQTP